MSNYIVITLLIGILVDQSIVYIFRRYLGKKEVKYSALIKPITVNGKKLYMLCEDYAIDGITLKKGTLSDGASIPRFAWRYVGTPYAPEYIIIAFFHDELYKKAIEEYKNNYIAGMKLFSYADKLFYAFLRDQNSKIISYIFFLAVRVYSLVRFGILKRIFK
ncbi:MAG: DUF1353 domain-containing protein [Campylobacteraceae bacterium]